MVRRVLAGLLVLSAALVIALPAATASAGAPVLGAKAAFPNGKGFGSARPEGRLPRRRPHWLRFQDHLAALG